MNRQSVVRRLLLSLATGALMTGGGPGVFAQTAPAGAAGALATPMPVTPTTRVLAIGRLTKPPTSAALQAIMPGEVRDTLDLYLTGKIADWYVAKDAPGVVFILDIRSVDEARQMTSTLPLVKAGLMQFEFIPLGPLAPLKLLAK